MNLNVIKIYIKKIKKDNLISFLNNQNIILNEEEIDYLYNVLKYDYEKILEEDAYLFNNIKSNINPNSYNKLIELFKRYKDLYL